jgi:hypothetical protein
MVTGIRAMVVGAEEVKGEEGSHAATAAAAALSISRLLLLP